MVWMELRNPGRVHLLMTFLRSSWTGRSVVSSATDTVRSQISTSGLHLTRVSALRADALRARTPWSFSHSQMQAASGAGL